MKLLLSSKTTLFSLVALLFLTLSACEKYITPNRVTRKIEDKIWTITSCNVNGTDIKDLFSNREFHFREAGYIAVSDVDTINGKWTVGLNKKPTTLYISAFLFAPYFSLNDNWEVQTCTKNKITMQVGHGTYTNSMTLSRVED